MPRRDGKTERIRTERKEGWSEGGEIDTDETAEWKQNTITFFPGSLRVYRSRGTAEVSTQSIEYSKYLADRLVSVYLSAIFPV